MELSMRDLKELIGGTFETKGRDRVNMGKNIVILQRGWVMVGDLYLTPEECELKNAKVIRVWGTTKGLGEIALNGPTPKTVLDDCGTVTFHRMTTIAEIQCNQEKWR